MHNLPLQIKPMPIALIMFSLFFKSGKNGQTSPTFVAIKFHGDVVVVGGVVGDGGGGQSCLVRSSKKVLWWFSTGSPRKKKKRPFCLRRKREPKIAK